MHYFVVLTTECNLRCLYCYGENYSCLFSNYKFPYDYEPTPSEITYSISDLKKFIEKDNDPTIIFYGGEPTLRTDLIKQIMDQINAKFMLQTNGTLLKNLGEKYVKRLENVMFSIDGDEQTNDYFRGKGTYKKIIENVNWLRKINYKGEVLARMTVMEPNNFYDSAKYLMNIFDSIHWQLNALFYRDYEIRKEKFEPWKEKYREDVRRLFDDWMNDVRKGKVYRIYPFIGLVDSFLKNERVRLRCGAGWAQYVIQTDGKIAPCVAMMGMKDFYAGDIFNSEPSNLLKFDVGGSCNNCKLRGSCGGRCLYANLTMFWGVEGFKKICSLTEDLIMYVQDHIEEIRNLINKGIISIDDFNYPKFNSCEIIP